MGAVERDAKGPAWGDEAFDGYEGRDLAREPEITLIHGDDDAAYDRRDDQTVSRRGPVAPPPDRRSQ